MINYDTRIKSCRICDIALKKFEPRAYDCRKDWTASAKSMEADMAVTMLKSQKAKPESVARLVTDIDSNTSAKLRQNIERQIDDLKDINHTKKNLSTHLSELQARHKN